MSLYKTETELSTAVLQHIGELAADETIDSNDETYITTVYRDKWAELSDEAVRIAYWPRADIPVSVFRAMVALIANEIKPAYGQPMTEQQKESEEIVILRRLRRHVAVASSGHKTPAVYY